MTATRTAGPTIRPASACMTVLNMVAGLSLLVGALAAQRQQGAADVVDRAAIEALLEDLDGMFARGDVDGYLGRFEPDHPGAHGMLANHLERLCSIMHERRRESQIIAGPQRVRDRTVVRVRQQITWRADTRRGDARGAAAAADPREFVEDVYLAVRAGEVGEAVPTFAIDMPEQVQCVREGRFRCPPCNYQIGGVDGFLCVPLRREQSMTLEAASFYLIGTDLACDISVHVEPEPVSAAAFANRLAAALCDLQGRAEIGVASRWRPPAYEHEAPEGFDAARVAVTYPDDDRDRDGRRMAFHVVAFGGLQHVLLLRGSVAGLRRHRPAIDELLSSYMLLRPECDGASLAVEPLRHHTGGVIEDTTYRNEHVDVVFEGPAGWRAEQRVGGSTFRVRWSGPNGSQLWLVGQRVPTGLETWDRDTASRWLSLHCTNNRLERIPSADDGWRSGADGVATRTLVLRQPHPEDPATPRRRILHARVDGDLLLIVDAFGGTEQDEQAIRRAIGTLTRN